MTSPFSDSIVFTVHTRKQRFQNALLWRAFSNGSVFGDRFWRCSVDDSRIESKKAPFSFENGLVCLDGASMFPVTKSRETLGFELRETKFTVPQGTSHEVICYKEKQTKANFEKRTEFPWPAHGIWRETVSLLDIM